MGLVEVTLEAPVRQPVAEPTQGEVTRILRAWSNGDPRALDRLMPLVYGELRRLASRYLRRERPDHTLQATALVHEAFLRLVGQGRVSWQNRAHFFGVAAQLMRRILVDHARRRLATKRRGQTARGLPEPTDWPSDYRPEDLLAVNEALDRLSVMDPRQGRVVELRFFSGLPVEQTAAVLGISPATVKREWSIAKAWLSREVRRGSGRDAEGMGEG